ncbi:hypothetical protein [Salinarimonas soli]|uniref:DUF1311 domain-containing protein n=1 Tax=Salinarimonas soli TaxID=1638099 RepID=A0A5B2VHL1_9HYPH|nr:hypothetical protein [Salinarimonas soli]KAA2237667.1 hypothetical protein F0L46_08275 [Salinarimonas soli]
MLRPVCCAVALALLTSASAQTDRTAFPVVDVEAGCAYFSSVRDRSERAKAYCMRIEQPAYDFAKRFWSNLTDDQRRTCRAQLKSALNETAYGTEQFFYYSGLADCVRITLRESQSQNPEGFRY